MLCLTDHQRSVTLDHLEPEETSLPLPTFVPAILYDSIYNYKKLYYWKIYIEFCISFVYNGAALRNTI